MYRIKWGIIGCGDVTEVKSGPAFNKVNNSSLVAVMRRDAAKAEDYARRHSGKISFSVFGGDVTLHQDGAVETFVFDPIPHVGQPMIELVTKYFLGNGNNPCSAESAILSMELIDQFTASGK